MDSSPPPWGVLRHKITTLQGQIDNKSDAQTFVEDTNAYNMHIEINNESDLNRIDKIQDRDKLNLFAREEYLEEKSKTKWKNIEMNLDSKSLSCFKIEEE